MKTFLFTYEFNGKRYCAEIEAESHDDAEARIRALSEGTLDGEFVSEEAVDVEVERSADDPHEETRQAVMRAAWGLHS